VLTETAFLFRRAGGIPAQVAFLDAIVAARLDLIALELNDLARARDIMDFYQSARFDFVDCCIMALSERLNITQVCTLDRRDFSIFRPGHCPFLELLP
jgi:predicted nucleic acid-binding protein